jgi:hypothetical protein
VTGTALIAALQTLEGVLQEEAKAPMTEGLAARKEAALAALQAQLSKGLSMDDEGSEALAVRLRALLIANSFSLKWTGFRAQLARLCQPKAPVVPPRPRLDLVH